MRIALITLSVEGSRLIEMLAHEFKDGDIFLHEKVSPLPGAKTFGSIMKLTADIFPNYGGLLYIAPCGAVIRALAPHIRSKKQDPAVVAMDAGGRYVISVLGGHEGGANDLAIRAANIIGAEPVITTTTEALKPFIVGIGCRRGVEAERIIAAVQEALAEAGVLPERVRCIATADVKTGEAGLIHAAEKLGLPLRIIGSAEIRSSLREFAFSPLAQERINLPAVAEPAALLAGRRTQLLLSRRTYKGITVAIARERFPWSESDRETR